MLIQPDNESSSAHMFITLLHVNGCLQSPMWTPPTVYCRCHPSTDHRLLLLQLLPMFLNTFSPQCLRMRRRGSMSTSDSKAAITVVLSDVDLLLKGC